MTDPVARRVEELFHEVVHLDADARARRLDEACRGNEATRRAVEALLAAHDQAGEFLAARAVIPPDLDLTLAAPEGGARGGALAAGEATAPPERVGRYRILQEIGSGGFGTVYMAEQEEPIRRKVALKVLKAGMDTREVIARFEAERQALALMDHPNIAAVFDAGATAAGRPYFVMELVHGVSITEYCDRNNLGVRERLALFMAVCSAVQHAHQKGVIHRDLKPSNVLVTLHDGTPVPKVIDFGIAKASNQRLTEKTLFTRYGQFIGSPCYMSPEQAEMSGLDVDTRSDVYSLGVLLYELVTGSLPFSEERLREAGLLEIHRILREEEPPRPSVQVSTLGERAVTTASRRATSPEKLLRQVAGDLDWVILKALEKDRTRRYDSASALSADLRRYLEHDVVSARPPSAADRLRKLVRRNRGKAVATAAVLVALLTGLALATAGLVTARYEAARAQREAARAGEVVALLQQILGPADRHTSLPPDITLREILDGFAVEVRGRQFADPEVEATLRLTMGNAYKTLGDLERSGAELGRAMDLRRAVHGEHSLPTAEAYLDWGWQLHDLGRYEEAGQAFRRSLALHQELAGDGHPFTAESHLAVSDILRHQGAFTGAREHGARALALRRALYGPTHPRVAAALNNLGLVALGAGEVDEAERHLREAVAMRRQTLRPGDPELAIGLQALASALLMRGPSPEAEQLLREALAIRSEAFGPRSGAAVATGVRLGRAYLERGDLEPAEPLLLTAYEVYAGQPGRERSARDVAGLLRDLHERRGDATGQARWQARIAAMDAETGTVARDH